MTMRYGYIGLGSLGGHFAGSLLRAGFPLTVHDLDASSPPISARRARPVPAPSRRPRGLRRGHHVPALARGGRVRGRRRERSPRGPCLRRYLDRHEHQRPPPAAGSGSPCRREGREHCLEAPVTGGVHRAAAGQITVLVGGEEAVFEAHRPALEAMGGRVFYIGPLGKASVIKVITNMLAFIHLVADGEALMLAKRGGVDLKLAWDVIKASSGNSFVHETEGAADLERQLQHQLHHGPGAQGSATSPTRWGASSAFRSSSAA